MIKVSTQTIIRAMKKIGTIYSNGTGMNLYNALRMVFSSKPKV